MSRGKKIFLKKEEGSGHKKTVPFTTRKREYSVVSSLLEIIDTL